MHLKRIIGGICLLLSMAVAASQGPGLAVPPTATVVPSQPTLETLPPNQDAPISKTQDTQTAKAFLYPTLIEDPRVRAELTAKIVDLAYLAPATAAQERDILFTFLYYEHLAVMKAYGILSSTTLNRVFTDILRKENNGQINHNSVLINFWSTYLRDEQNYHYRRQLIQIASQHLTIEQVIRANHGQAPASRFGKHPPFIQAYWDHYQQGSLEQHLKYVATYFCPQRKQSVHLENFSVSFPYALREHSLIKSLMASAEFKELLTSIQLLIKNDAEMIMQDYDIAISDEEFSRNPAIANRKLQAFHQKIMRTPPQQLPLLLQKLQENKDFQHWTFGSPRQANAFRKFVRGTLFFWETHAIADHWAKVDPVIEEYTYQDQTIILLRHFRAKVDGQDLEFYISTNKNNQWHFRIVRYGTVTTNEENIFALATTKSIFYEGNYKNINLAARLANSTPDFVELANKAKENDTLENNLLRDHVLMGHRLKRVIWSTIFMRPSGRPNQEIDVNGHILYNFRPNAYRIAPYRTNLDRSLNGTRLIRVGHHRYEFIAAAFEGHDHYEKWLSKNRNVQDPAYGNELTIFYNAFIQPILDQRDQEQYQQQYHRCARLFL